MNNKQLQQIHTGKEFIAALDQSGGSTPKALERYGIMQESYATEDEMFDLVHELRTRIITSPAFNSRQIIGAILFEQTMDRKILGMYTTEYLAKVKGIVPFLKVDKGLAELEYGVQLMKPMPELNALLQRAKRHKVFGTKMRSVIKELNPAGIKAAVKQQFDVAKQIIAAGLVPIIEPEVDIYSHKKEEIEAILRDEILLQLDTLGSNERVMLKLTIPTLKNTYTKLIAHSNVLRVVALSGGYSREDSNEKLRNNDRLIASFSRALTEHLRSTQSDSDFDRVLADAIASIYDASVHKNADD